MPQGLVVGRMWDSTESLRLAWQVTRDDEWMCSPPPEPCAQVRCRRPTRRSTRPGRGTPRPSRLRRPRCGEGAGPRRNSLLLAEQPGNPTTLRTAFGQPWSSLRASRQRLRSPTKLPPDPTPDRRPTTISCAPALSGPSNIPARTLAAARRRSRKDGNWSGWHHGVTSARNRRRDLLRGGQV
jgi:hypothetical protein